MRPAFGVPQQVSRTRRICIFCTDALTLLILVQTNVHIKYTSYILYGMATIGDKGHATGKEVRRHLLVRHHNTDGPAGHTFRNDGDDLEVFAFEADLVLFFATLLVMAHPL